MQIWPFNKKVQKRQDSADYTDAVLSFILANSTDSVEPRADVSSGAEMAAGILSRAVLNADIKGSEELTVPMLYEMIRDLILYGEIVWIRYQGEWVRCAYWDIEGGITKGSWRYRVDICGPSSKETRYRVRNLKRHQVFHVKYSSIPSRGWEGNSPLRRSNPMASMATKSEQALRETMNASTAAIIAASLPPQEGETDPYKALAAAIQRAKGKTSFVESPTVSMGERMPSKEWEQQNLGPRPSMELIDSSMKAQKSVALMMGIPSELIENKTGQGMKEAYKFFLINTALPLCRLIEWEWKNHTGEITRICLDDASTYHLEGKTKAFGAMVKNGMDIEEALKASGLFNSEDAEDYHL